MMKVLFIGGSGNISSAVSRRAIEKGIELYHLNRGNNQMLGVTNIKGNINDTEIHKKLAEHQWDAVVNWVSFNEKDVERDFALFQSKTKQYIYISSASAYQKPPKHYLITESTPLENPYWDYSRDKIACENKLNELYRKEKFPITIVRPSLTYDTVIPAAIGGWNDYTFIQRLKDGKPALIHGDGNSLWTITHSEDFALGFVGLIGNLNAIGESFHITSDEVLTWNDIYECFAAAAGVKLNTVHIPSDFICSEAKKIDWCWMGGDFMTGNLYGDKAYSAVFDNSKIKKLVPEFEAKIPFSKGIKRTVKWFEEKPERMVIHEVYNKFMDTIIDAYKKK